MRAFLDEVLHGVDVASCGGDSESGGVGQQIRVPGAGPVVQVPRLQFEAAEDIE